MKRLIFLLLISGFCFGCKKDNTLDYSSNLIGKWSWFISCPGITGTGTGCWMPDSIHPAHEIAFTSKSIYNLYYNDTLGFSCEFHTYKSVSEDGKYTGYIIKYDSGYTDHYSISHDTLLLVNSDGILTISSRYKRIK